MTIYLVTYDLNTPGKDYKDVLATIKSAPAWAQVSKSSYALESPLSADELYAVFAPFLDANDQFYILKLADDFAGQGPVEVNEWLGKAL